MKIRSYFKPKETCSLDLFNARGFTRFAENKDDKGYFFGYEVFHLGKLGTGSILIFIGKLPPESCKDHTVYWIIQPCAGKAVQTIDCEIRLCLRDPYQKQSGSKFFKVL